MGGSFMAEMTWEAFGKAVEADPVAVIPMGSTELEGPHLPLGVDTIVADGVARRLDGAAGIIIGPTLPIGYSKWFMPFPGTITLETETLVRVLTEYTRSLIDHGIRRFVFLNSHRGNNACVESVARTLVADHSVRVAMLSVWKLANDLSAVADRSIEEGRFTHAGEIMTSTIMALAPHTVVSDRMGSEKVKSPPNSTFKVKNSLGETEFKGSVQTVYQDIRDVTDFGTMGDPGAASAAKGESIINRIVEYTKDFLQEFRKLALTEPKKSERA
ncbi:MAG: creatininase family protein [Desulfobacterales bacterium]|nr:creatininase family protein [Desulfobacterales bacterium]